ncbi:MAG: hypothetical protein AB7P40_06095 [Chloroflexota bacterium]
MQFSLEFLALQARFAERVAALSDLPLDQALFFYTSLPLRFGVPFQDLTQTHPAWQAFLADLQETGELSQAVAAAHERAQRSLLGLFPTRPQFGCFSCEYLPAERAIRLHFANRDASEPGVLSEARVPARLAELAAMFKHVRSQYPEAHTVIGTSWLYNREAYRRLFPPEFTASLSPVPNDYHGFSLWGQFLDRRGAVRADRRDAFLAGIKKARNLRKLAGCFPLPVLRARADVEAFFRFYRASL